MLPDFMPESVLFLRDFFHSPLTKKLAFTVQNNKNSVGISSNKCYNRYHTKKEVLLIIELD